MSKPLNIKLYDQVKKMATKKFESPTGIYRSAWIVKEYKKRGGKYSGEKSKTSGLTRWFKEKWIDLTRPIKNSSGKITGYKKCGRKSSKIGGKYPTCRPSKRISKSTPKTYKELSKKTITRAKKLKQKYTRSKNVSFTKKVTKPKKRKSKIISKIKK